MNNQFYDVCLNILLGEQNVPEVLSTLADIKEGLEKERNFPRTQLDFIIYSGEIISYIQKVRTGNIVDAFKGEKGTLALLPIPNGKLLSEATPEELYNQLDAEMPRLILKGLYQLIKHYFPKNNDKDIMQDLFSKDIRRLNKYGFTNNLSGELR